LVQNTNGSKQQPKRASSTASSTTTVQSPKSAPHVMQVSTLQEFKKVVVDDATDQVTAVRFYAPWCRSCHAIQGAFYRLGRVPDGESTSKLPNVKFVQVAVGPENAALHQGLGVPSLPYAHIYHQSAGLVEELRMNKKLFGDFEQILQSYNDGACALPETVDPVSGVYEAPYERS
jgi:thiol:disulfide interchange protein